MSFFSRQTMVIALCGIIAGSVFSVSAYTATGGILAIFFPVLPLAFSALAFSARRGLLACLVACVMIGLLLDASYVLFFAIFIVFPLYYFLQKLLLWRGEGNNRQWYPVLRAIAEMTAMVAGSFMMIALIIVYSEHKDLNMMVWDALKGQLDNADPKLMSVMTVLIRDWSFLIFVSGSWLWVLMIYAFTVLANMLLQYNNLALRPSLAIEAEGLPLWLLVVVLISAATAFLGHGNDQFAGRTAFLTLLLPYFLSGIASVHVVCSTWKNKKTGLVIFYSMLLLFPWISIFLIGKGLYTQIEGLLKGEKKTNNH